MSAKIGHSEQGTKHLVCGLPDHDGSRVGQLLQTGGQIWRFADDRLLTSLFAADEIAADDKARCDADTRREGAVGPGRQPRRRLDHGEARPDGSFGFVFMGQGPAEVGEDAVSQELGDVALEAHDLAGNGVLVGPNDLAHVLRIEVG